MEGISTRFFKLQNFCHFPMWVILGRPFSVFLEKKEPLSMLCLPQAERKWEFEEILACQGEKGSPSSRVKKERMWHSSQPEEKVRIL